MKHFLSHFEMFWKKHTEINLGKTTFTALINKTYFPYLVISLLNCGVQI